MSIAEIPVGMWSLFNYNRANFRNDREQRQKMEYQLADMKLNQAGLWREDIQDVISVTNQKMEVYLIVIALELGFCVTALCKARCPPGSPPWLASCHTLALMGALTYLFLALWLGMHAFVASQAYKVRIRTQLARLPVPTWQMLEAGRTYGSAFEGLRMRQMLRVPVAMQQESHADPAPQPKADPDAPGALAAPGVAGTSAGAGPSADPWGLERRGDFIEELEPDVNERTAQQKHIWQIREAAVYYQTYDAFCRVSMSAGTSSLATFFCYFCLSYVSTENAAPVAAWGGMVVFIAVSLVILRLDVSMTGRHYGMAAFMMMLSPLVCAVVTFFSSKNGGDPGRMQMLMPLALGMHGAWLFYYLWLFRVKETEGGALLPTAASAVLYLDVFGWASQPGNWERRRFFRGRGQGSAKDQASPPSPAKGAKGDLPSMACLDVSVPRRPEDVDQSSPDAENSSPGSASPHKHMNGNHSLTEGVNFRPGTFAGNLRDEDDTRRKEEEIQTGADNYGQKPGLLPAQVFVFATVTLATLWWVAAFVAMKNAVFGTAVFVMPHYASHSATDAFHNGWVAPMLIATKVETHWPASMEHPHGLACDHTGASFVTSGRSSGGHTGLLHGEIKGHVLRFEAAPFCPEVSGGLQDLAVAGCSPGADGCSALVLPKGSGSLAACPLTAGTSPGHASLLGLPVSQNWLDQREGSERSRHGRRGAAKTEPEELSSVSTVPCNDESGGDCVVVGTTARRLVKMSVKDTNSGPTWVPRRVLLEGHGDAQVAGGLAVHSGRYLAMLHRNASLVTMLDMEHDGKHVNTWKLPRAPKAAGHWSSLCAGGGSLYALEGGDDPTLWKFAVPTEKGRHSDGDHL